MRTIKIHREKQGNIVLINEKYQRAKYETKKNNKQKVNTVIDIRTTRIHSGKQGDIVLMKLTAPFTC